MTAIHKECDLRHRFLTDHSRNEKNTRLVLLLTVITMLAEIIAGYVYGSMALLADGWHMGTHAAAFMITLYAYRYARKYGHSPDYSFGTGKVGTLGGFASAVALAVVALLMLVESIMRLFNPQPVQFDSALCVAVIGLFVNLICAFLLGHDHHVHSHDDHHPEGHHDHNLSAAYMHVLADALTSLLAIVALGIGKFLNWSMLDTLMGFVGGFIIFRWALQLIRQTSPVLLDASIDGDYRAQIRRALEVDVSDTIVDMHIWKVSEHHFAAVVSMETDSHDKSPSHYKALLKDFLLLEHVTIEVNQRKPSHG